MRTAFLYSICKMRKLSFVLHRILIFRFYNSHRVKNNIFNIFDVNAVRRGDNDLCCQRIIVCWANISPAR